MIRDRSAAVKRKMHETPDFSRVSMIEHFPQKMFKRPRHAAGLPVLFWQTKGE
jgi:hypothetical protein